jgi:predicted nucleotidyltransferase
MSGFGLDDRALRLVRGVLERHVEIREARIFGSRAKGNYRPESDVDIAIFGDVDSVLASRIASELDDLPLPYLFDVQAYACIKHAPLRDHIDRVGLPLFVRADSDASAPGGGQLPT